MSSKTYADFLVSQGKTVVEQGGVNWMEYQGALIPAAAMPVYVQLSDDEAAQLIKETGALFLRYTTASRESQTNWWYVICRQYDFQRVSSNTRSKIRRGLKRLEIKQVIPAWLAEHAYDCHVTCYRRYKHATPQTRDEFRSFLLSINGQSIFDTWACSKNKQLLGYIICLVEENGIFMHTIDLTPEGLHNYAAYAMIHQILEYYVNEKGIPVSNGSRSISHATNMQDFLRNFGFEREFAELHVIYRSDIRLIVNLLYPFRNMMKRFNILPLMQKISSVLYQEEIVREQRSVQI